MPPVNHVQPDPQQHQPVSIVPQVKVHHKEEPVLPVLQENIPYQEALVLIVPLVNIQQQLELLLVQNVPQGNHVQPDQK